MPKINSKSLIFRKLARYFAAYLVTCVALLGCGDKAPPVPLVDCETDSVKAGFLSEFATKLKEEGAKGYTAASMKELLSIKDVTPLEKVPKNGYSKCSAKVAVKYPAGLPATIAKAFANEKAYSAFKDELEEKYGVVNGAGMHAQLMESVADGPFGAVPVTPDPALIDKYQKTIQKNLEALVAEQMDIAVSYELTTGLDPNGRPSQKLKWQINKRDALDINVVLMSIGSLQ